MMDDRYLDHVRQLMDAYEALLETSRAWLMSSSG